ncbi:27132_t:CDS:2, partial [Gigaspora margarita]
SHTTTKPLHYWSESMHVKSGANGQRRNPGVGRSKLQPKPRTLGEKKANKPAGNISIKKANRLGRKIVEARFVSKLVDEQKQKHPDSYYTSKLINTHEITLRLAK